MIIAIIGGKTCEPADYDLAMETGKLIAERGHTLICGGLGGIVEAACQGARTRGGVTVGILPGDDLSCANEYVSIPLATNMGLARNAIIIQSADVIIAGAGSYGTLSEIALAHQLGKPVIGLHSWQMDDINIMHAQNAENAIELAEKLGEKNH